MQSERVHDDGLIDLPVSVVTADMAEHEDSSVRCLHATRVVRGAGDLQPAPRLATVRGHQDQGSRILLYSTRLRLLAGTRATPNSATRRPSFSTRSRLGQAVYLRGSSRTSGLPQVLVPSTLRCT